jgi:hypothetical protein
MGRRYSVIVIIIITFHHFLIRNGGSKGAASCRVVPQRVVSRPQLKKRP